MESTADFYTAMRELNWIDREEGLAGWQRTGDNGQGGKYTYMSSVNPASR